MGREHKGQQHAADCDTPWCSTGNIRVFTKNCLQGLLKPAEVSGNTAKLQCLCGVQSSYREFKRQRKKGLLHV